MTAEIFLFILLFLFAIFLCFNSCPITLYKVLSFCLFISFSAVTRFSGFDIDMQTYSIALKSDSYSIYYLKEPVYWFFSRIIFWVLQSEELTFVFFDIISFYLIFKSKELLKMPQYFPYLLILFFPMVMGLNNVYRQYLSVTFFIYFFSVVFSSASMTKKVVFFALSALTHNVAFLFSPVFLH